MISINSKYPEMIFRRDVNGYASYSIGLSNKRTDGTFENGYMKCRFKKGIDVKDRTKIIIKDGFVSFYNKNKETIPVLFITDFEEDKKVEEKKTEKVEEDPYEAMGKEIEIEASELPF